MSRSTRQPLPGHRPGAMVRHRPQTTPLAEDGPAGEGRARAGLAGHTLLRQSPRPARATESLGPRGCREPGSGCIGGGAAHRPLPRIAGLPESRAASATSHTAGTTHRRWRRPLEARGPRRHRAPAARAPSLRTVRVSPGRLPRPTGGSGRPGFLPVSFGRQQPFSISSLVKVGHGLTVSKLG